jgi:hypothetical protein
MAAPWGYSFRSSDFNGSQQRGAKRKPDLPSAPEPGDRHCAQGQWCAGAVTGRDGSKTGAPGPRAFCDRDRGRIESALAELPRLYVTLAGELGRPMQPETVIRSPFGPKLAIRGDIDAIMRLYVEVLVSWHVRVATVARLSMPAERDEEKRSTVRDGWYVDRAVRVLSQPEHFNVLLALDKEPMRRAVSHSVVAELGDVDGIVRSVYAAITPDLDGGDAGLEILRLHRVSGAILGETRARPQELIGVPCRVADCDMMTLYRAELPSDPDAPVTWSKCASCGDQMTEAEYREWVAMCAAYERNRRRDPEPLEDDLPGVA